MTLHAPGQSPAPQPRALLIEETGAASLIARRLLARLGYQVDLVSDAAAAARSIERAEFELLLIDLKLEGLGPLHELATLRTGPAAQAIVIALGAASDSSELHDFRALGIDGRLERPLDLQRLQHELTRCQAARRAQTSGKAPGPLDASALLEEVGGDRALLSNLAALFEEQAGARMRELADAVERRDADRIDHSAHALKSMIGLWQRGASYELAASLERMGREHALESAPAEHHRLIAALGELQGHIHELLRAGERV